MNARWFGLGLGLLVLAGCAVPRIRPGPAVTGPVVLTAADTGVARVAVGAPVEVRLRGNAGNGFRWVLVPGDGVEPVGDPVDEPDKNPPGYVGGGITQHFTIRVIRPGPATARFSYDRPWAGGQKGARTAQFQLEAR